MTFSFRSLEFRTNPPDVPSAMPIAVTEALNARERAESVGSLAEVLRLGNAIEVDLPFGYALASKLGQVEFFSASGAVRARNTAILDRFEDERREWPDAEKTEGRDGVTYVLGERTSQRLVKEAHALLNRVGLAADDGVAGTDVVLGQWALLDTSGRERASGPGRATVRMSYAVEGVPLIGPGAKTNVQYEHVDAEFALTRLFHVLRRVVALREVDTGGTERAFDALVADPFLQMQAQKGGRVVITGARVGLLALPADRPQRITYPALEVQGVVDGLKDERKGDYEMRFGRYVPVVSPEALRRAGVAVLTPDTSAA